MNKQPQFEPPKPFDQITSNPHTPPAHSGVFGSPLTPPQQAHDTWSSKPAPLMGPTGNAIIPPSPPLPFSEVK